MNRARLAAVILLALVAVGPVRGSGTVPTSLLPPVGLKPFLLRTDEPAVDTFPRTPSFAWWPYAGASSYGFELATSKTFDEIRTPEGKQQLREEIIARVNQVLDRDVAKAVYFTEFIVQ